MRAQVDPKAPHMQTMKGKLESATIINGTAKLGDVGEGPLTARRTGDAGDIH